MSERPDIVRATDDRSAERPFSPRASAARSREAQRPAVSPHSAKFRLATGFLLGIGVAALAIAIALASRPSSGPARAWSSWSPNTGGKAGATEIAEHVAPYYRLTSAQQLDVVTLVNLSNPSVSGTGTGSGLTVAINTALSGPQQLSLLGGSTVAYNLCGTGGSNCQLAGTPSTARMLLLRREAFELSLYTFKYVSGTQYVVCLLPPGHTQVFSGLTSHLPSAKSAASSTQTVSEAVVFSRQGLQPWLNQPLSSTLSQFPPTVPELPLWQKTQEAGLVDQITARGLFTEQIESQQTGGNLLVLNQLPPS